MLKVATALTCQSPGPFELYLGVQAGQLLAAAISICHLFSTTSGFAAVQVFECQHADDLYREWDLTRALLPLICFLISLSRLNPYPWSCAACDRK